MEELISSLAHSMEIPSISDRLEFLYQNPLQIQELTFKENCRPLNQIIDLTYSSYTDLNNMTQDVANISERYQIVSLQRLIFSFNAGRLFLRVVNNKKRPVVLVLRLANVKEFIKVSRDAYETLLADWDRAPPVVIELFNSSFTFGHKSRYGILVYDLMYRSWELIGFIAPLNCAEAETIRKFPYPMIRLLECLRKALTVNYTVN